MDVARSSTDPQTRMDAMAKVQDIVYEDVVVLTQFERGSVYVAHPRLKGVVRSSIGTDPTTPTRGSRRSADDHAR